MAWIVEADLGIKFPCQKLYKVNQRKMKFPWSPPSSSATTTVWHCVRRSAIYRLSLSSHNAFSSSHFLFTSRQVFAILQHPSRCERPTHQAFFRFRDKQQASFGRHWVVESYRGSMWLGLWPGVGGLQLPPLGYVVEYRHFRFINSREQCWTPSIFVLAFEYHRGIKFIWGVYSLSLALTCFSDSHPNCRSDEPLWATAGTILCSSNHSVNSDTSTSYITFNIVLFGVNSWTRRKASGLWTCPLRSGFWHPSATTCPWEEASPEHCLAPDKAFVHVCGLPVAKRWSSQSIRRLHCVASVFCPQLFRLKAL